MSSRTRGNMSWTAPSILNKRLFVYFGADIYGSYGFNKDSTVLPAALLGFVSIVTCHPSPVDCNAWAIFVMLIFWRHIHLGFWLKEPGKVGLQLNFLKTNFFLCVNRYGSGKSDGLFLIFLLFADQLISLLIPGTLFKEFQARSWNSKIGWLHEGTLRAKILSRATEKTRMGAINSRIHLALFDRGSCLGQSTVKRARSRTAGASNQEQTRRSVDADRGNMVTMHMDMKPHGIFILCVYSYYTCTCPHMPTVTIFS